ncbi:paraneoplastic antigen Ma2 homolog [Rana temporaria]|uniref:paraneoplastic antigen Ma2 homolog n=1 Tax=Rana temporaria TaxID=8407 RepID=UPI001AACB083|nr:paraneoplastic antigen Ma2 homolog [Rana temporaria]
MDAAAASKWCKEENVTLKNGLVVEIKGEVWTEERLLPVLRTLSADRKPWIVDMRADSTNPQTYALCEWKTELPDCFKGASVNTPDCVELVLIHPTEEQDGPTSSSAPAPKGPKEQKTKGPDPTSLKTLGPELCAVLGEIVAQCKKDSADYLITGYRKLRTVSGRQPVPSSKDGFEKWLDHATQALEEWEVPERHKKQRLMESLREPALEAIRNLKLSKRDCAAQDYLDVLQSVFGRTENASELHYQLEHCFQKPGEKLPEFVGRLDKILHQILLKKGIDPRQVDKIRAQQVIRGAQPMDPIALQLRTLQGGGVLKYPDLIRMIRQEEVLLDQKNRQQPPEPSAQVRVVATEDSDPQVELLRTQVSQLIEMVVALTSQVEILPYQTKREEPERPAYRPSDQSRRPRRFIFCFNCGGVGHTREVCPSPAKASPQMYKPAENFRGHR